MLTERLSGRLLLSYDRLHHRNIESTVGLMYNHQCWGLGVDYTKTHDDQRVMIKVSLAGLGMLRI
jgi:lipopolysaccharide assembly outer membrane protein LptD (OstA)